MKRNEATRRGGIDTPPEQEEGIVTRERIAEVRTPHGIMETLVTHPEQDGPFPPVVVFMDIWGVREELFDIARRIATVGYYCVVPDLYYRQGRIRNEFRDDSNRMISLHRLDEERKKRVFEPRDRLSGAMIVADTGPLLKFLGADDRVKPGPVESIGYCMGGWSVLAAAGHYPDHFQAGASLHGTCLITEDADSPIGWPNGSAASFIAGSANMTGSRRRRW